MLLLIASLVVVWFFGMVATRTVYKCADIQNDELDDECMRAMSIMFWPITLGIYLIYLLIVVVATGVMALSDYAEETFCHKKKQGVDLDKE